MDLLRATAAQPWRATVLCLALGTLGGALFTVLGAPVPWLLGAMLTTTAATLGGASLSVAPPLRAVMLAVIGVLIGSGFEQAPPEQFLRWFWSLAALPLYVVVIAGLVMAYLHRVGRFDPLTAYFSAAPGGLGEMILLADKHGADVRRTSLVHALRVLLLVTAIPFVVDQLGLIVADAPARAPATLAGTAALAGTGLAGFLVARLVRLPNAVLLGPMLASALVHVTGWSDSEWPGAVVAVAQIVVGASVGSRFSGLGWREVAATLGHGAVITVVMLALSAGFAWLIHPLAGVGLLPLMMAYVPGGVAEMALVAIALGVDPAYVSTHHVVRIMLVVSLATLLVRWVQPPGR